MAGLENKVNIMNNDGIKIEDVTRHSEWFALALSAGEVRQYFDYRSGEKKFDAPLEFIFRGLRRLLEDMDSDIDDFKDESYDNIIKIAHNILIDTIDSPHEEIRKKYNFFIDLEYPNDERYEEYIFTGPDERYEEYTVTGPDERYEEYPAADPGEVNFPSDPPPRI